MEYRPGYVSVRLIPTSQLPTLARDFAEIKTIIIWPSYKSNCAYTSIMAARHFKSHSLPSTLLPCLCKPQRCARQLHQQVFTSQIPPPTPFVPDAKTFLTLIGRGLSQHAAKIPTWQSLFSLTSAQLRELGVEPARNRRYLLWWRDKFRKGVYGVGGDLKNVMDAVAQVRVVEVPRGKLSNSNTSTPTGIPTKKKLVLNLPPQAPVERLRPEEIKPVERMKVVGAHTIVGPYIQPVKGTGGSVATIKVQEGMWEVKRGHKVDGGERRKVQVRRKRLLEERKTTRK